MTLNQRRIVFALLVGLMFFDGVAINPMGPDEKRGDLWTWTAFWSGSMLAQVSLMATWAALRRQPWVDRLPALLGLACMYALVVHGVAARYPAFSPAMAQGSVMVVPPMFVVLVLALMLLRRVLRWELVLPEEVVATDPSTGRSTQFTLRHLFLWLTEAAILCALIVWFAKAPSWHRPIPPGTAVRTVLLEVAAGPGVGALIAAFVLPMLVSCLGLVLVERRRWFALALALVVLLGPIVFIGPTILRMPSKIDWYHWLGPLIWISSIELAFVGVFCGVLVVTRLCGYRLRRGRASAAAASPFGTRSHFALVIGVLLLTFLVLGWAAVREREVRRWAVACQEWRQTGVNAYYAGDGIGISTEPNKPMGQATLDRLAIPEYAAQITMVSLAKPAGDAQMLPLAKLPNLRCLNLAKTDVTDAGLVHLYGLKQLISLNLPGTQVTADGVAQFQRALPDCRIFGAPPANPPSEAK